MTKKSLFFSAALLTLGYMSLPRAGTDVAYAETPVCRATAQFSPAAGGCLGLIGGRIWSRGIKAATWAEAYNFCANLRDGGFNDWALPDQAALVQMSLYRPAEAFNFYLDDFFWTANGAAPNAAAVLPVTGQKIDLPVTTKIAAFCARRAEGSCKLDSDRFVSVVSGCKDVKSGLIWSWPAPAPLAWDNARIACTDRGAGWRLPTREELKDVAGEDLAATHFNADMAQLYWSGFFQAQGVTDYQLQINPQANSWDVKAMVVNLLSGKSYSGYDDGTGNDRLEHLAFACYQEPDRNFLCARNTSKSNIDGDSLDFGPRGISDMPGIVYGRVLYLEREGPVHAALCVK